MTNDYAVGDYLILRSVDNPNRKFLGQVVTGSLNKGLGLKVVEEHNRHIEENVVEVDLEQVVVNLGSKPEPGTVYGIDLNDLFLKRKEHDIWGSICFFRPVPKDLRLALGEALDKTGEAISRQGLAPLFYDQVVEIRSAHGKYAGKFISGSKSQPNRVLLFLTEEHTQQMRYVLYHEFGHSIQHQCLKEPRILAAWMKLFRTSVQHKTIGADVFKKMLKEILAVSPEDVANYSAPELINSTEDDELLAFKVALRYMQEVFHVSGRDFKTLLLAGDAQSIKNVWPRSDIDKDDLKPIVTEYATKNVTELFAEAYAYYMIKKKLPKDVTALLEKSLSFAKHQAKYLGQDES